MLYVCGDLRMCVHIHVVRSHTNALVNVFAAAKSLKIFTNVYLTFFVLTMTRYLIFFSYIGTKYRGMQKQSIEKHVLDTDTIQGALEAALLCIKPKPINFPALTLSSRTDGGVHALCSSVHVHLENSNNTLYDSHETLKWLNRYFIATKHTIRALQWIPVTDQFHARFSAKSRTYVYRFMIAKDPTDHRIPIMEYDRCTNVREPNFDIEKVRSAMKLFLGRKDFQTFSGQTRGTALKDKPPKYVRTLERFTLEETQSSFPYDPLAQNFNYWNIVCTSRGFLYNQVRRMVGALLAVGAGRLTESDIKVMLTVPSHNNWNPKAVPASPAGLYLANVAYDAEELERCTIRENQSDSESQSSSDTVDESHEEDIEPSKIEKTA